MAIPDVTGSKAQREQVFLIGDSIGVGLLPPLQAEAARRGIVLKGAPIGGWRVKTWVANSQGMQLTEGALQWPATTFVVVLGTNDVAAREVPDLSALVSKLRARGAKVVWIGPGRLPTFSATEAVCDGMAAQAGKLGVPYLDARRVSVQMSQDQVHPTPAGYKQLAAWAWPRLAPELLLYEPPIDPVLPKAIAVVGGLIGMLLLGKLAGEWLADRAMARRRRPNPRDLWGQS